ncbi:hypothetical protein SD70_28595 [Gordoniibacillus kamchatkensis]|uniref:Uncharacterized protein n=1 Tax=Gordoniibacillus kamchatkensis TaxID=1590651 RepID=A0ABR5AAM2_9BACL|nr:hypothetical protein SD70_28595 [Paenibacillus sp. VKM B-2647]
MLRLRKFGCETITERSSAIPAISRYFPKLAEQQSVIYLLTKCKHVTDPVIGPHSGTEIRYFAGILLIFENSGMPFRYDLTGARISANAAVKYVLSSEWPAHMEASATAASSVRIGRLPKKVWLHCGWEMRVSGIAHTRVPMKTELR